MPETVPGAESLPPGSLIHDKVEPNVRSLHTEGSMTASCSTQAGHSPATSSQLQMFKRSETTSTSPSRKVSGWPRWARKVGLVKPRTREFNDGDLPGGVDREAGHEVVRPSHRHVAERSISPRKGTDGFTSVAPVEPLPELKLPSRYALTKTGRRALHQRFLDEHASRGLETKRTVTLPSLADPWRH